MTERWTGQHCPYASHSIQRWDCILGCSGRAGLASPPAKTWSGGWGWVRMGPGVPQMKQRASSLNKCHLDPAPDAPPGLTSGNPAGLLLASEGTCKESGHPVGHIRKGPESVTPLFLELMNSHVLWEIFLSKKPQVSEQERSASASNIWPLETAPHPACKR